MKAEWRSDGSQTDVEQKGRMTKRQDAGRQNVGHRTDVQQKSNERPTNRGQTLLQRWRTATLTPLQLIVLQRWPPLCYNSQ
jgi:hypothetical protein